MSTLDDLAHVIDRIPFLGTMRSDLSQLRRILADRRAPRVRIGAPGSGRTTLANELLLGGGAADPGRWPAVVGDRPGGAVGPRAGAGAEPDWLELDAGPLEGERLRRLEQALAEARPT